MNTKHTATPLSIEEVEYRMNGTDYRCFRRGSDVLAYVPDNEHGAAAGKMLRAHDDLVERLDYTERGLDEWRTAAIAIAEQLFIARAALSNKRPITPDELRRMDEAMALAKAGAA